MPLKKITTAAAALAAGLFVLTSATPALAGPAPEEAAPSCRDVTSSISGASIRGTVCWRHEPDGNYIAWVDGTVTDSAGDGKYAMFRLHYRHKDIFWNTETKFLKTTKGKHAPVTLSVHSITYTSVKDFWIQVCKQGSGDRTCDSEWH